MTSLIHSLYPPHPPIPHGRRQMTLKWEHGRVLVGLILQFPNLCYSFRTSNQYERSLFACGMVLNHPACREDALHCFSMSRVGESLTSSSLRRVSKFVWLIPYKLDVRFVTLGRRMPCDTASALVKLFNQPLQSQACPSVS